MRLENLVSIVSPTLLFIGELSSLVAFGQRSQFLATSAIIIDKTPHVMVAGFPQSE